VWIGARHRADEGVLVARQGEAKLSAGIRPVMSFARGLPDTHIATSAWLAFWTACAIEPPLSPFRKLTLILGRARLEIPVMDNRNRQ